jgi:serine/threonine-protein kinase
MILAAGTRLGQYEVVAPLGSGGMGEVYRARDTKLGRDVALKVLPDAFTLDRERIARFKREAQVLASLNHPNIAAIYGIEDSTNVHALVLELVEGETLADRIAQGPVPFGEAIAIADQIADALEAAHERGVIHRDLKPANVALKPDGTVKVLDFGLAKALEGPPGSSDPSLSPTITTPAMTQMGMILGTAAYMSPEQARGKPVDHRADVWAFGVVLFEMLTGQRLHPGETVSDTLASVLKTEPSWNALPHTTPSSLRRVLRSCLEKDPRRRLQAIGDRRLLVDDPVQPTTISGSPSVTIVAVGVAAVLAVALVTLSVVHFREPVAVATSSPMARVAIALPQESTLDHKTNPALALSPDGTKLTYVAVQGTNAPQLFLRVMDGTAATPIAGTEGAHSPFFSPDGQWIGFFAQGKLKKVPAAGGAAQVLSDAPVGLGGDWAAGDTIYFVPYNLGGVWRVAASGGTPEEITKLNRGNGEVSHRWPQALPGGKGLLLTVWVGPGWDEKSLQLHVLATGERRVLAQGASSGRYVASGHVVYNRDGAQNLMALPFDLARLQVKGGPAVTLAEQVWESGAEGAQFAVSDAGTVAYVPSHARRYERRLVWVDRQGKVEPLPASARPYLDPRLSPDGQQLALSSEESTERIWTYNFARSTLTALTSASVSSQSPVWMPDGTRIVYRGTRKGFRNLYWKTGDGSDEEQRLSTNESVHTPMSVSPDGTRLAFTEIGRATGNDIWTLSLGGDRKAEPFLVTPASENNAHFSPDGHWLAYASDESGRFEVYVQPFPGPGRKWTISTDGGNEPVWSRDGREMFYRSGDAVMAVPITSQPTFAAGLPHQLFSGQFEPTGTGTSGYDVSLDGRRFLMIQAAEPELPATQVSVVINWFEELRHLVPTGATP